MLDIQQQTYKDAMEIIMKDLTSRIRQVESRNTELLHSLEFTQKEVEELKTNNKTLIEEVTTLKKELSKKSEVDEKIIKLQSRIDYQEDYSRRNNLRFDGLDETPNETWEETQVMIQQLMRDKLKIGMIQLERAHRVGPKGTSSRPRTVVARFSKFEDRQLALRNSAKLKDTNIFINEDLCESSMMARKSQLPELRRARADGKIAYFNHTKLVIRERTTLTQESTVRIASAASVVTVSPAATLGAGVALVGALDGAGSLAVGDASAAADGGDRHAGEAGVSRADGMEGDHHDEGREASAQRKSKRKNK